MKMNDIITNSSTFINDKIINDLKLKNGASVKSIKIPLLQNESNNNKSNYFNCQSLLSITQPKIQVNDNHNINNNESDLTELSWLTSNVNHMFANHTTNGLPMPLYVNPSAPSLTVSTNFNTTLYRNTNCNTNQTQIYKHKKYHHKKYNSKTNSSSSSSSSSSSAFNIYSKLDTNFEDIKLSSSSSSSASSIASINNPPDSPLSSSTVTTISPSSSPFTNSNFIQDKLKNNCGLNKPPLTLSCLIFMSLQESKDKCLPVREIYAWIEDNFPYYKSISNGGWKSSIRHNLSFSKCFKKMDKQTINIKSNTSQKVIEYSSNGRKRRAPNSNGTCWKVNPECKTYLIQMLKKSTFWFHNSSYYPNLNKYIVDYMNRYQNYSSKSKINNSEEEDQENFEDFYDEDEENDNEIEFKINKNLKSTNALSKNNKSKVKSPSKKKLKKEDESYEEEEEEYEVEEEEEEEDSSDFQFRNNNLLEFVQKQNEKIFKREEDIKYEQSDNNFDSNDLAAVCTLASANRLELSFSSTTSSSSFSSLSSSTSASSTNNNNNYNDFGSSSFNSDLEMEVASTLADMKWFANRKKQLQQQ